MAGQTKTEGQEIRPRLLVCEDLPLVQRDIRELLGESYEFSFSPSVEHAMPQAITFAPDLIISDLNLDGMDGYQFCRWARARPELKHVPFILLTAQSAPESRATGLELGADDYLAKPIQARELQARVRSLLRLRRATLQLERQHAELEVANRSLLSAQDALIAHEKMASLGRLVAGIAHEINNPINFIYGNTELLKTYVTTLLGVIRQLSALDGLTDAQKQAIETLAARADLEFLTTDICKMMESIRNGARRAASIVSSLRDFAHVAQPSLLEANIVEDVIEPAVTLVNHELRDRISVERRYTEVPLLHCDPSRLQQVFVNLIVNAAQAIEGSGKISISVTKDGAVLRCSVADTGAGMDPTTRGRLFEPFFTTKAIGKGTGLGLSISYGIVEQHGGRIEVTSKPGEGSTFTVVLPLKV